MATSKRMTPAKSAKTGTKRRPATARTTPAKPERRTGRLFVGALLVCALVGAVAAGLALLRGGHEFKLELGVPTEASAAQLGKYASSARPVYWIGAPQSGKLEVTRTASGVFVRYLPAGVDIGDSSAGYTTVATYPVPNASSRLTDCSTACAAGQKKKMRVTASCGISSNAGNSQPEKMTRRSMA